MKLNVSTYRGYIVAAGLRGPDEPGDVAKHWKGLVTGVLRYYAGIRRRCVVNNPRMARSAWDASSASRRRQIKGWACRNNSHAQGHSREAFDAIGHLLPAKQRKECADYLAWLKANKLL